MEGKSGACHVMKSHFLEIEGASVLLDQIRVENGTIVRAQTKGTPEAVQSQFRVRCIFDPFEFTWLLELLVQEGVRQADEVVNEHVLSLLEVLSSPVMLLLDGLSLASLEPFPYECPHSGGELLLVVGRCPSTFLFDADPTGIAFIHFLFEAR